jgi:hypothetical protein
MNAITRPDSRSPEEPPAPDPLDRLRQSDALRGADPDAARWLLRLLAHGERSSTAGKEAE